MDLLNLAFDPYVVQIALLVLFLAAAFITLRVLLKLARKLLTLGCAVLLVIGAVLFVTQFWK